MSQTILTHTDNPDHAPYLQAIKENSLLKNELLDTQREVRHQRALRNASESDSAEQLRKLNREWEAEARRLNEQLADAEERVAELEAEWEVEPGYVNIEVFELFSTLILALVCGVLFGVMIAGNVLGWLTY